VIDIKVNTSSRFYSAILFALFILSSLALNAQDFTISGNITDAKNGEDLFGARVIVKELSNTGAEANVYGFYSLTLPKGSYTLVYRYTGYENKEISIDLSKDLTLNTELSVQSDVKELEEVTVTSKRGNDNITSSQMDITKLNPKEIETIPILFGEQDVMKTLQLTPGIKGAGEGNSGFFVRGGGADQNLILLDESIVYNASHLLGFFSVFNSDALKDVSLYKSGIPAEYGGRASSVMDVKMRDGNNKNYALSGGIGLISSRLTVEGPIVKDKGAFIVSGRRSYADIFLPLADDPVLENTTLYFYDLNAKANYKISDKDRVFVSGYFGRDDFKLGDQFGFDWGNATGTFRWNRIVSDKLFSNTSIMFSNFDYRVSIGSEEEGFGIASNIRDWSLKQDFSHFINSNNTLKYGLNAIHHTFRPGSIEASDGVGFNEINLENRYALELGAYIQNEQKIGNRFSMMYGVRYSGFNYMGEGTDYQFDQDGNVTGSQSYESWESIRYWQGIEPRFSSSFILSEDKSIKAGYNRIFQYIHQLSNTTTSTPVDAWVPTSNNVAPQIGDQVAIGYYQNFKSNEYQFSVEGYYKWLQNQIDYRPNADLILNDLVEGELVYGRGMAYGAEFQLKKTKGKFTGWVNYTLSRALRQFDEIDNGAIFPARQDRIHDLNVVLTYKFNEQWVASTSFVYYTGDAVTFPTAQYAVDGFTVPYIQSRNGNRFPDYHRLDLGLTWYGEKKKRFEQSVSFSIYNVYARENTFAINFIENAETGQTEAVQTALFRLIPSITWNFKIK
jgi:hypothetical protein